MLACDAGPTTPPAPAGPELQLRRVAHVDLACTDPCGMRLTYEARRVDTGEPAAAQLQLSGDGSFPARVQTALPDGQVTFYWEYPRPRLSGTSYRLTICPAAGQCDGLTATVYLPE